MMISLRTLLLKVSTSTMLRLVPVELLLSLVKIEYGNYHMDEIKTLENEIRSF